MEISKLQSIRGAKKIEKNAPTPKTKANAASDTVSVNHAEAAKRTKWVNMLYEMDMRPECMLAAKETSPSDRELAEAIITSRN